MEDFIEKTLRVILSEYGAFVLFLLIALFKVWVSKERAVTRNNVLSDRLLEVVEGNTAAMSNLISKIDHQKEVNNARNL